MSGIGLVEALVEIIASGKPREEPAEALLALCNDDMPSCLRPLVEAFARYDAPLFLSFNSWELGLLNEASARKQVALAGGSKKVDGHEHVIGLAMETGGLVLVAGYSKGAWEVLYEVDYEYQTVKPLGSFDGWLREQFEIERREGHNEELVRRLQELMGASIEAPEILLEPCDSALWDDAERLSDEATDKLLRAGKHICFCVSDDGTAVAVHQGGVRFVGKNGKRKAKGVKGFRVESGSISEDGSYALVLNGLKGEDGVQYRFIRIAIPGGEASELPLDFFAQTFAHLRDGHVLLATEGVATLYAMEEGKLVERQRLASADIAKFPTVTVALGGRLFLVKTSTCGFLGAYQEGEVRWVGRMEGSLGDGLRTKDGRVFVKVLYRPHELMNPMGLVKAAFA